ncbi:MAG: hypothetical protein QM809_13050 [Gordonia sp. (in: high G+C Gram-positive bacteria)]|uniref:hypothetical protein n=1 Tax=Gordonia sp. (in: high G+C Gram-positive bacteria) TaxID=84139 RepID=UPI0039E522B8
MNGGATGTGPFAGLGAGRLGVAAGVAILAILTAVARPAGPTVTGIVVVVLVAIGAVAIGRPGLAKTASLPDPAAPQPDTSLRQRWARAVDQHDRVLSAYGAYELDPAMLLRFPAMWDLAAPPIVDFHDALELAGGLRSDEFPGEAHAQEYLSAVAMLRTDWAAADRHARSTGTDGLAATNAGECRKALNLWRHADGTRGPERATYLEKVLGTIDALAERGVVDAPAPMHNALVREVQKAIEAT